MLKNSTGSWNNNWERASYLSICGSILCKRPQGYVLPREFRDLQLTVKILNKVILKWMARNGFLKKVLQTASAVVLFLELNILLHWAQRTQKMSWLTLDARTRIIHLLVLYPGISQGWVVMKTCIIKTEQLATGLKWGSLSHCWHRTAAWLCCVSKRCRHFPACPAWLSGIKASELL